MRLSNSASSVATLFDPQLQSGELLRLLPDYQTTELTIQAVYPTARYVPLKVRRFIDYLAQAWSDQPAWDHPTASNASCNAR